MVHTLDTLWDSMATISLAIMIIMTSDACHHIQWQWINYMQKIHYCIYVICIWIMNHLNHYITSFKATKGALNIWFKKKKTSFPQKKNGTIKPSLNPPLNQTSPPLNPQKKPIKPRYQLSPPISTLPSKTSPLRGAADLQVAAAVKLKGLQDLSTSDPPSFFSLDRCCFFLLVVCFWGFLTKRFLVQECFLAKFCCWSNISRFKKKHRIMYRLIFMEGHFSVAWKKNTIFSSQLNSLRKIRSNEIGHPQPLCTDTNWSRSAC